MSQSSQRVSIRSGASARFYLVHRLPPELMAEIFQHSLPTLPFHRSSSHEWSPLKRFTALDLGAVCRSWRRIAWATPSLWPSLHIHANPRRISIQVLLLEQWLSRSGKLPLDVAIGADCPSCNPGIWSRSDPEYQSLIAVANRYASQWRSLVLRLPEEREVYVKYPTELMPLLRSVDIQRKCRHFAWQDRGVHLGQATSLQHLALKRIPLNDCTFTYTSILTLNLKCVTLSELVSVLAQCPRLHTLDYHGSARPEASDTDSPKSIEVPSIKSFGVSGASELVLDLLIFPELSDFTYSYTLFSIQSTTAFVSKSPRLESFTFDGPVFAHDFFDDQDILDFFTAMPSLKKLAIEYCPIMPLNDWLLSQLALVSDHGIPIFLPKLETLIYTNRQTFTWPAFISAWRARKTVYLGSESSSIPTSGQDQRLPVWRITLIETDGPAPMESLVKSEGFYLALEGGEAEEGDQQEEGLGDLD